MIVLDVVTSLIVENVYDNETGHILSQEEMIRRGLHQDVMTKEKTTPMETPMKTTKEMSNDVDTKSERVESFDDDGYDDEFEVDDVEDNTKGEERESTKIKTESTTMTVALGRVIDPPSTDYGEDVVEEDLVSDDETYVDRMRNERQQQQQQQRRQLYSTKTTTEATSKLFQQLMEERSKSELLTKELDHQREREELSTKLSLYEAQLVAQKKEYEAAQLTKDAEKKNYILQNKLTMEMEKRKNLEEKIEHFSAAAAAAAADSTTSSSGSGSGSSQSPARSSLGALLRASRDGKGNVSTGTGIVVKKNEQLEEEEEEKKNNNDNSTEEGVLTNIAIIPQQDTRRIGDPSSLVFLQPTHMHPDTMATDKKRQFDDLLSDYSTSSMEHSSLSELSTTEGSSTNDGSDSSSLFHDTMRTTHGARISDVLSSDDDEDDSLLLNISAVRSSHSTMLPPPPHQQQRTQPAPHPQARNATAILEGMGVSGSMLGILLNEIEDDLMTEQ